LWPDFQSLLDAAGDWQALAIQTYGPLVRWMEEDISIENHAGDEA
jgi:hypothetical protein